MQQRGLRHGEQGAGRLVHRDGQGLPHIRREGAGAADDGTVHRADGAVFDSDGEDDGALVTVEMLEEAEEAMSNNTWLAIDQVVGGDRSTDLK